MRDVERAVAGRAPGDLPTDPPDDAVVEAARCDAQQLGPVGVTHVGAVDGTAEPPAAVPS